MLSIRHVNFVDKLSLQAKKTAAQLRPRAGEF